MYKAKYSFINTLDLKILEYSLKLYEIMGF